MILIALLALELALGAYCGMRSGRNRRRLDWVSFYMSVWAISTVAASASVNLNGWIRWRAMDKMQVQTIATGKILRIIHGREFDDYKVDFGNGIAVSVPRGSFKFSWSEALAIGIYCGAFVGVFSVLVRTITIRRMGSRLLPGHCETCGYNLTGNVSGICPECGTALETTVDSERLS